MVQDDWSDFVLRIGKLLKEPDIGVVFTEARPLTDDRVHMSRVRACVLSSLIEELASLRRRSTGADRKLPTRI